MRISRRTLGKLIAGTILGAPAFVRGTRVAAAPTRGGILKFGLYRDPVGLDPHLNYGATSSSLQGNVYDTLVTYDVHGNIAPALAASWSQPQPTLYIFSLRRNVTFHDGTPFTAADVLYSFKRILDPQTKATREKEFEELIESVQARGDDAVEVRLRHPSATFLDILAGRETFIVSRRWAEAGGDFKKAMNGTGAFRLASYEPNVRYILERFPKAWDPASLDRVELAPILDDRARVNALKSGQADFIEYLPWQDTEFLMRSRDFRVYRGFEVFNMIRLNPTRPPLVNLKVRQALNFAINRETVSLTAFGGQAQLMDGFLLRKDAWAYNPETSKVWTYDPQRALALLKDAGLQRPQDLHLVLDSANLTVHLDTAQVVATMLRSWGATVDLKINDVATLFQKRVTGDYTMMMDGLSLPWADPDFYYRYFHSTGTAYAAAVKFKNARLDQLLEEGQRITDRNKRRAVYADVERILFQEAPWIFVVWRPQAEAARSVVKGYVRLPGGLGALSVGYLNRVWIEK
jgi:ABC-type transport system substrate-binding protein